jgi:hypothetical protein
MVDTLLAFRVGCLHVAPEALPWYKKALQGASTGTRAHLPESLSEHFGGEVVASPYLPPIVQSCYDVLS